MVVQVVITDVDMLPVVEVLFGYVTTNVGPDRAGAVQIWQERWVQVMRWNTTEADP